MIPVWFLTHLKLVAAFAVLAALLGLVVAFGVHERGVQKQLDLAALNVVKASLERCHANVSDLQDAISASNAELRAKSDQDAAHAKMLVDALQSARKEAGRASVKASAVLAVRTSEPDQCAALRVLDRAVSGG